MSAIRLLIKPVLFTTGVCGTCYCGAAIVHYENRKRPYVVEVPAWFNKAHQRHKSELVNKFLSFRQKVNNWKNQLSTGHKIAGCTIFANFLVLCAWRVKRFYPVMNRYFLSQVTSSRIPLSPMILSCFSHSMPLHFAFNMYALYSFSNFATALLGPEQLVALFLSAGAVSSLSSVAARLAFNRGLPSLGASGALLGVISYVCISRPESELLLFFIPIAAGTAVKALLLVDFVGLIARWRYIDHAAHLGGSLFGIWYATYGEKMFYKHRNIIIKQWKQLKSRYD